MVRLSDAFMVLWWVPAGATPTVDEAKERLQALRAEGPTPYAFTFKHRFPAPDMPGASRSVIDDREFCPAG